MAGKKQSAASSEVAEAAVATPPAGREKRIALIKAIESNRDGRLLIAYITSTRPGFEMHMGDDVLPFIHECLEKHKTRAAKGVVSCPRFG
jgi:hypothetical protein